MKRIISLIVLLSLIIPTALSPVYAVHASSDQTYIIPQEIRDANFQQQIEHQINAIQNSISTLRDDRYHTYYNETVETQIKTVSGFAGQQPSGGVQFETGGSFYWKDSGGPEVNFSVTFSAPVKVIDLSVGLGISAKSSDSVAYIVNVPASSGFYKLHVTKNMEVRHVIIWETDTRTGVTKKYMDMYPSTLQSYSLGARKV